MISVFFLPRKPFHNFLAILLCAIPLVLSNCQSSKARLKMKTEASQLAEQAALERGREIYFDANIGTNGLSCNSCHPKGAETRAHVYPRYKHVLGTMATLSMTHNFAVVNENRGKKWELGSEDANALTLYVTFLANGKKMVLTEPIKFQNEWIEKGKTAFFNPETGSNGKSCATCHTNGKSSLKGIAAVYPQFRAAANRVLTLEQQIHHCLTHQLAATALPLDHETIVSLTCYLAYLSQGSRIAVAK